MKCSCFACPGETPVRTYEVRRRDGETHLYGPDRCPHCDRRTGVNMKRPRAGGEALFTFTCVECRRTWPARLVEQKEVTSL